MSRGKKKPAETETPDKDTKKKTPPSPFQPIVTDRVVGYEPR